MSSADVSIVVSAKDEASRILAGVEKSTQSLTQEVTRMADASEESGKRFEFAFKGFAVATAAIGAVFGGVKAISAAIAGMSSAVDAFNTQEEAARGMTQAQLDFAASLQIATNFGDEATLGLLKYAEAMGFSKEESDDAVTAALGLAEAFGVDQAEALKKVAEAAAGNIDTFAEMIPGIVQAETAAEKLAMVNEAVANGLVQLQTDAGTTRGAMERSAGAFGDLQEKIGAIFDPLYRVVHQGLAVFAETLQSSLLPAIDTVNTGFDSMRPFINGFMELMQASAVVVGTVVESIINVVQTMTEAIFGSFASAGNATDILTKSVDAAARFIIQAITFIEVGFTNFGTVVGLAIDGFLLHLEQMRADLVHNFTVVLPEVVRWFADNFFDIIQTAFDAVVTVITNHVKKIVDAMKALWDFIASGGSTDLLGQLGEIAGRSYLEGFESSIKELPEIATRGMTATEAELTTKMALAAGGIANEFNKKFNERIAKLEAPINATAEIDIPDLASIVTDKAQEAVEEQTKGIIGQGQQSQAGTQALQAAESRLLTRGTENTLAEKTLRLQEEQNRQSEEMAAYLAILAEGEQRRRDGGDNALRVELV